MTTGRSWLGAALPAYLAGRLTGALVTRLYTLVPATRQRLATGHATAEVGLRAGNGLAQLVVSVTQFRRENHAGRTGGARMAVVLRRMIAWMNARARKLADWLLGATRHWWIDHFGTTLAIELFETAAVAWRTIAAVTRLIALVFATTEGSITWQWTVVVYIDAALNVALVFSTAALLGTTSLATGVVRSVT